MGGTAPSLSQVTLALTDFLHPLRPLPPSPSGLRPYMALDPKSRTSTSDTTNYRDSGYAPSSGSTPGRREPPPFHYFPSLQGVLRHPRILGRLLPIIPYGDFNALTSSCSELRNLMAKPALKDVILSCFLPGFRSLLLSKTPELFVDVRVTISDLNVFCKPNCPYLLLLFLILLPRPDTPRHT